MGVEEGAEGAAGVQVGVLAGNWEAHSVAGSDKGGGVPVVAVVGLVASLGKVAEAATVDRTVVSSVAGAVVAHEVANLAGGLMAGD